ncbi:MAG: helix-turn-helix transcriptional regulator [Candidatus Nanopelagicales bacterium]
MVGPKRRLSKASTSVLAAMYEAAPDARYGMELMDAARAPSGTLYPILARFRDWGWLIAEREDIDPATAGRPARTYYRLTSQGLTESRALLPQEAFAGRPSWAGGDA